MTNKTIETILSGKSINFLIGSGASMPIYPSLRIQKLKFSFEDIVSCNLIEKNSEIMMYLYYFLKWIEPMNIAIKKELFLDNQNNESAKTLRNYDIFIKSLINFLYNESNERPKRVNIFTTNYDLLFEYTFDQIMKDNSLVYFNDGSRGFFERYIDSKNFNLNISHSGYNYNYTRELPTINLYKLHGSISWEACSEGIKVVKDNAVINRIKSTLINTGLTKELIEGIINEFDYNNGSLEAFIQYFNSSIKEKLVQLQISQDILDEFWTEYQNISIINPNKYKFNKTVLEQHYYQMIRSFSYELEKKQSILIVLGFSFADEHLKSIFERSLTNPELLVIYIPYSKDTKKSIESKFKSYPNIIYCPDFKASNECGDFSYLNTLLNKFNNGSNYEDN